MSISENTTKINQLIAGINALPNAGSGGEDGFSPIAKVTQTTAGAVIEITDKEGITSATVNHGEPGKTPVKGVDYFDGKDGVDGKNGTDGHTPVRGEDYWTDADKESVIQEVLTVMGMHIIGVVNADNTIILTGELADGTYTLKYENAEGILTEIGTIEVGEADYVDWLSISTDTDGSIYNGVGYKVNTRLSASSGYTEVAITLGDDLYLTGFIPVKTGDVLRFYNMTISDATDENYIGRIYVFDTSKTGVDSNSAGDYANVSGWNVVSVSGNVTQITYGGPNGYIRINADEISADSIITINQEIV